MGKDICRPAAVRFHSADMGARLSYLVFVMLQKLLAGAVLTTDEHDISRDYAAEWRIRSGQRQVKSSTSKPNKLNYYSRGRALSRYGFVPKLSALEAVMDLATVFLADCPRVPA
jgi:hypothetical protein